MKTLKKITAVSLLAAVLFCQEAYGKADPGNLYALSAVLMDAKTGQVLYEKDGEVPRPNASTTKVLTCIVALENAPGDDYVQVSANAALQPDVQLGIREGEQYYLEDLLYSLMLKSHNDSAVAIAEHVGGSVEGFAKMMNEKAGDIGCKDTYFITPNGLDAKDQKGIHHTTARDLSLIMRYAIQNESFLKITQTRDYSFSEISGKQSFSVRNANALLDMMDGVISGKTGFTGDAGYCYVCACQVGDKTLIVALLGSGWPNHKNYKWADTRALLKFGDENFQYHRFWTEPGLTPVAVLKGTPTEGMKREIQYLKGVYQVPEKMKEKKVLVPNDQAVKCRVEMMDGLTAPVKKGQKVGEVTYTLGQRVLFQFPVVAERNVEKMNYRWIVEQVFERYFH